MSAAAGASAVGSVAPAAAAMAAKAEKASVPLASRHEQLAVSEVLMASEAAWEARSSEGAGPQPHLL